MSDEQTVEGEPESRLRADSITPGDALDARVLELAHAALFDVRPPAALGLWELSLSCALVGGYAVYAFEQALKILTSS